MYEVVLSRDAARTLERATPLRIGEMRAVYEADSEQRVVVVHAIGSRGDIYKK